MKKTSIIFLIYASIVLIGGIMGYLMKGSLASLIAGSLSGALLLSNAIWMLKTESLFSLYTALCLSILVDGFFTYRLLHTHLFFPSGPMCLITLFVILKLAIQIRIFARKNI